MPVEEERRMPLLSSFFSSFGSSSMSLSSCLGVSIHVSGFRQEEKKTKREDESRVGYDERQPQAPSASSSSFFSFRLRSILYLLLTTGDPSTIESLRSVHFSSSSSSLSFKKLCPSSSCPSFATLHQPNDVSTPSLCPSSSFFPLSSPPPLHVSSGFVSSSSSSSLAKRKASSPRSQTVGLRDYFSCSSSSSPGENRSGCKSPCLSFFSEVFSFSPFVFFSHRNNPPEDSQERKESSLLSSSSPAQARQNEEEEQEEKERRQEDKPEEDVQRSPSFLEEEKQKKKDYNISLSSSSSGGVEKDALTCQIDSMTAQVDSLNALLQENFHLLNSSSASLDLLEQKTCSLSQRTVIFAASSRQVHRHMWLKSKKKVYLLVLGGVAVILFVLALSFK